MQLNLEEKPDTQNCRSSTVARGRPGYKLQQSSKLLQGFKFLKVFLFFSPGGELQRPLHPGAPQGRPLHTILLHPATEPGTGLRREERRAVSQPGNQRHLQPGRVLAQRAHTHPAVPPRRVSRAVKLRQTCLH